MSEYPAGLPQRYRWHWNHPWRRRARLHLGFRRWLRRHGYLSPHFTKAEAACKDGTPVPKGRMTRRAQKHAFKLEKFRHKIGDRPVRIISWYRTPEYNRQIGGASKSQHMNAVATDHPREWVEKIGTAKVDRAADEVWKQGGVGRYPGGDRHFDSRGWYARWTSF